jgi:hypothetical protein
LAKGIDVAVGQQYDRHCRGGPARNGIASGKTATLPRNAEVSAGALRSSSSTIGSAITTSTRAAGDAKGGEIYAERFEHDLTDGNKGQQDHCRDNKGLAGNPASRGWTFLAGDCN